MLERPAAGTSIVMVGSTAVTVADRGSPSSNPISPTTSPGPSIASGIGPAVSGGWVCVRSRSAGDACRQIVRVTKSAAKHLDQSAVEVRVTQHGLRERLFRDFHRDGVFNGLDGRRSRLTV